MRHALTQGTVLVTALAVSMASARADEAPQPPPAAPEPAPTEPKVDPAYGEKPDPHESATRVGADEGRGGRDIVVRYHPDRSTQNVTMLALLGGAGLLFGGVGLYFHLDSRTATDDVKAHSFTGRTWTAERQDTYDRAHDSARTATIAYSIGGAFLLATAIAYIITDPPLEALTIHPHTSPTPAAVIAPIPGGALVESGWSF